MNENLYSEDVEEISTEFCVIEYFVWFFSYQVRFIYYNEAYYDF